LLAESEQYMKDDKEGIMKAVRIHVYGGPEVLVYKDAPRPAGYRQRDHQLEPAGAVQAEPHRVGHHRGAGIDLQNPTIHRRWSHSFNIVK